MSPAINLHRSAPLGWSTLLNRLSAPVDISFLVYLRIAYGAVVLWQMRGIFANNRVERYLTGKDEHSLHVTGNVRRLCHGGAAVPVQRRGNLLLLTSILLLNSALYHLNEEA